MIAQLRVLKEGSPKHAVQAGEGLRGSCNHHRGGHGAPIHDVPALWTLVELGDSNKLHVAWLSAHQFLQHLIEKPR